jgi:hypothetical protein
VVATIALYPDQHRERFAAVAVKMLRGNLMNPQGGGANRTNIRRSECSEIASITISIQLLLSQQWPSPPGSALPRVSLRLFHLR